MTIHHGDCVEVMATLPEASVDAIVTDPPYGIRFMGKAWDGAAIEDDANRDRATRKSVGPHSATRPGRAQPRSSSAFGGESSQAGSYDFSLRGNVAFQHWTEAWATAALRVAKPGAYLLAFGGTRTVHRMTVALEDAGWVIRDMLVWAYASGFPKSRALLKPAWEPIVMARKPGPLRELDIDGCRIGTDAGWSYPNGPGGSHFQGGAGTRTEPREATAGRWPANVVLTDPIFDGGIEGVVGGGWQESTAAVGAWKPRGAFPIDNPNPIVYGDTGTYSRFFTLNGGPGCFLCGRARPADESSSPSRRSDGSAPSHAATGPDGTRASTDLASTAHQPSLLDSTTSDTGTPSSRDASGSMSRTRSSRAPRRDVPTLMPARANSAGASATSSGTTTTTAGRWTCATCVEAVMRSFMDGAGSDEPPSYPRWFLIPKASRSDREPVMPGMLEEQGYEHSGPRGHTLNGDGSPRPRPRPRTNQHPTVKPIELMRHLVRLVTPPGGTCLDPFLGSGTTALAAEHEGRAWVGIEREAEYVRIAEARLAGNQRGLGLDVA